MFKRQKMFWLIVFNVSVLGLSGCGKKKSTSPSIVPLNQDQVVGISLNTVVSAQGDVVIDEENRFSLTRLYSFSVPSEKKMRVKKISSNGNCGNSTASFVILKDKQQITDATINGEHDYGGVPVEEFPGVVAAGNYSLVTYITLKQECKGMLYFYDFKLEDIN